MQGDQGSVQVVDEPHDYLHIKHDSAYARRQPRGPIRHSMTGRVAGCLGAVEVRVADGGLRFCAYQYQNLPLRLLRRRWRTPSGSGSNVLWNCDMVVEPDRARHVMFDGPTTLTRMAAGTTSIRVGTLVSSLHFRHPVTLTKATMTLDHLSRGRVELALGVGDPSAGAAAAGVDRPAGRRVARPRAQQAHRDPGRKP